MRNLRIHNRITNRETKSFKQYLDEISDIKMFTPEEEAECSIKAANGDRKAGDELIERNLRFVVSVAKQYETAYVNLEDLVNEGNIGLIMAAEKYRVSTGFKFITYAVFWIRKMILEYLAKNGRIIRLPANKISGLSKYNQQVSELEQKLGRNVEFGEMISELGVDFSIEDIEEFEEIANFQLESLDNTITNGDNATNLYEMMADESFKPTDHLVSDSDLKIEINTVLETLKPRDREIIVLLFGLNGEPPLTLKEVGEKVGLTREMVRQIKQKSLEKLKLNYLF